MNEKIQDNFDSKKFNKEVFSQIITLTIAVTLFEMMNLFFNFFTTGTYYTENFSIKFSMLIGLIVYTFLFAIFKKASITTIICYSLIFILNIINSIKILYTGEPIYFSDINFLTQVGGLAELAFGNISFEVVINTIIVFLFYAIILIGITVLNRKFDLQVKSKKIRISIIVIDILLILILFLPNNYTKNIYLKIFFNTDEYLDYDSYTNNINYYLKVGMINGMYGKLLNDRFVEPENYNEEVLTNILENTEYISSKALGKPNIVVVFAESFFDVDEIEEVKFDKNITSNFNALKNEGKIINLISPSYGGMSENVAFELFTGGNMNYFPKGYIPIMSLYSRKNASNAPSIIKVLGDNGYDSKIIFGKDYYNSEIAFKKMGFKEYEELIDNIEEDSITDEIAINNIIETLENKHKDKKMFSVIETFEGHMPYSEDKYKEYDITITKSKLEEDENIALRAYCQSIYNTDKQLGRLYKYIQEYDEPTMILFLGDHLPYLYTSKNKNILDKLEYFNTEDELLNYYRKYNTQCLVLANFDMSQVELPEYSGLDLIFPNIINQMDIENTKYYKWLNSTRQDLTASNRYISLDIKGNMYYTSEMKSEMKNMYDLKNKMQYMFFIK